MPDESPPQETVRAAPDLALQLQRSYGNQVAARMLARNGFTYDNKAAVQSTISTQEECDTAVEDVLESNFDGYRALFMQNTVATSVDAWARLLLTYLSDEYTLDGIVLANVKAAVKNVKKRYREETLLHMSSSYLKWTGPDAPFNADNLKEQLEGFGAYLDGDDTEALEALIETEGKFARTKVEFDPAANYECLDEDNVVVLIDSHQQKHQRAKIDLFPPYSGAPGSKFSEDKDLGWHEDNTALVVKAIVQQAVTAGHATPTKTYSPPKVPPRDGITYDITITYDELTGKYVGGYHCNPVEDEGD